MFAKQRLFQLVSIRSMLSALGLILAPFVANQAVAGTVSWTNYSVITIGSAGNASTGTFSTTSEVTGNAFVSGKVIGNSFTMAQDLPPVSDPSGNPQYALTSLGGLNFSNYVNINNGYSVLITPGSNLSGQFNFNGGGSLRTDSGLASVQQLLAQQVNSAAGAFSSMATTGTVSFTGGGTYTLAYTGPANGVAVFDLSYSVLTSGNLQRFNLQSNGASSIVINVTGLPSSYIFPNTIGWQGDFNDNYASRILWNFQGVTGTLETQNQFFGSILAPTATFTNHNYVDGSVWVKAYAGQGEIHYKNGGKIVAYNGFNPVAVPEPGSLALVSIAGGVVGCIVVRRRRLA